MLAEQLWRPTSGCEHSEVAGSAFLQWRQQCERQAMFWAAVHSCHTKKWRTLQLAHQCESADYNQGTVYKAEYWLQGTGSNGGNIAISQTFAPGRLHRCSQKSRKSTIRKFVRTYWINMMLKVSVSCIASLLLMRYGVTTVSHSQNGSPWSGHIWISHSRKSSRCSPQWVNWCDLLR